MDGTVKYPKLLIIANCCLSNATSNGRTLRNFLIGWPKDRLAQFCIHFESPDLTACDNYYYISDRDALSAFYGKKPKNGALSPNSIGADSVIPSSSPLRFRRNAFSMYARELVWSSKNWRGAHFSKWVDEFSPDLILFQAGDSGFLCKLAVELSEKRNIPLVVYNSEAYYFKNFDHLGSKGLAKAFYPILKRRFRGDFRRLMKQTSSAIYCCDMLTHEYEKSFDAPATTIYTATEINHLPKNNTEIDRFKVSYLGNLGVGRHESLIEIAQALQSISKDLRLDVYGYISNANVKKAFDSCPGINYCGIVSYEEVLKVMSSSDILVHTENFSDYYKTDLKYAFSTKIADSLASGTCFLLYAPEEVATTQYLISNAASHVVTKKEKLTETLRALISDATLRSKYLDSAKLLAHKNHDAEKNSARFQKILFNTAYGVNNMLDNIDFLFLGRLFSRENEQEVRSKAYADMQDAANVLQWNLIDGFSANGCKDITVVSYLPLDSWPKHYKDPFIKNEVHRLDNGMVFHQAGFCNVTKIKQILNRNSCSKAVKKWAQKNSSRKKVILCYSCHNTLMRAVRAAKKVDPNIISVQVIADITEFASLGPHSFALNMYIKSQIKKNDKLSKYIDGYVLLTELMKDKLNITKPYMVMEGIVPPREKVENNFPKDKKVILYTGSLNKRFGIVELLTAFEEIKSPEYRLVICGLGNAEADINALAARDPRVDFKGKVAHKDVLRLQCDATVLVNPRQNNEEFTKYSFPSKTMEYLASGTPVVAYKLDGIPDEYDGFINYVPDNSPATLASVLQRICELPEEERSSMGKNARDFVLKEKNKETQTKRILDFIGDFQT